MTSYSTQHQQVTAVDVARVRAAFACVMPARASWSAMPNLGITTIDHKPGRPRRLAVTSP